MLVQKVGGRKIARGRASWALKILHVEFCEEDALLMIEAKGWLISRVEGGEGSRLCVIARLGVLR